MNTISNERVEFYATNEPPFGYTGSDINAMARELLALRKERELSEPVVKAAEKLVRCKGRYHSEQNYRALAVLFGVTTPDLPPLETDTTSQQFESLAGKAVVPEGWKLVPVEPTKEMVAKMRYHNGGYDKHIKNGYAAMLAVAPEPYK